MGTVLITNAKLRKSLSAVRSLGARGIRTHSADSTRFTPTAYSKYSSSSSVYPEPAADKKGWYAWLIETIKREQVDVLFPMDDDTMHIVMEHREELERLCRLPLPPTGSYRIAADKGLSAAYAEQAGIPCPCTFIPDSLDGIKEAAAMIGYPVLIKPRQSSGSRGIRIVEHEEGLMAIYEQIHEMFPFPILQEYIPQGERFDVCLMYDRSNKLRYNFVQKELRHFPLPMGPSTVQESVWYPELLESALSLMDKLPWFGIVELEFMRDPRDGLPKLMEINPRFWNSVHLATLSGVDFPWGLYRLAIGQEVDEIHDYKIGVRCRWLLPGDLLHFITNPRRFHMDPPLWAGKAKYKDDIWSLQDPMPTIGFFLACLRFAFDRKTWRFLFRR